MDIGDFFKGLQKPLLEDDSKAAGESRPKPPGKRRSTGSIVQQAISDAATAADAKDASAMGECLRVCAPVIAAAVRIFDRVVIPLCVALFTRAYTLYEVAPKNVLSMLCGLALCFFGGTFVASIAAIEAFRLMGWEGTYDNCRIVYDEIKHIGAASAADDEVDADGDGVADVEQIGTKALAQRKLLLAMRTVKEPARLRSAVASLWAAYLAVLATLKLQFAQTVALAMGIVDTINVWLLKRLAPPANDALKELELEHWTETLIETGVKVVAIVLAWWLQVVVSAVYSALRGGRLFSQALCAVIIERGWSEAVEKLPGVSAPFDPETTIFDEVVGYGVAAIGFATQLMFGFSLGFPLNVLLLPLEIVEWILRWQITFAAPAGIPGDSASAVHAG